MELQIDILDALVEALPSVNFVHSPSSEAYRLLAAVAQREVTRFRGDEPKPVPFGPFGEIRFPYFEMGKINSLHLFGLDELIIFSYYRHNRARYRKVADIGANIGLHSLVLSRCGFEVRSFEPDPIHFAKLQQTLSSNDCASVTPIRAAVSLEEGSAEFVRVLGNTTGSHLAGAKSNPYGDLERFQVKVEALRPIMEWADLIKLDVEGHEAALIEGTRRADWLGVDAMIEVGTAENAQAVFDHLMKEGVYMFSQKRDWQRVEVLDDVPTSYREGSLFISTKTDMNWA